MCGGDGGSDGVSAVDIKVCDSSSALSFSPSLSADSCHFLSKVKYEVLQSIALALLILVYHVFSVHTLFRADTCSRNNTR